MTTVSRLLAAEPAPEPAHVHVVEALRAAMFARPWWWLGIDRTAWLGATFTERVALF